MNWYKRWLKAIAVIAGFGIVAQAFTVPTSIESYNGSGAGSNTQVYNLDGNGNLTVKGGLTVNGATASSTDGSFGSNGVTGTVINGNITLTGNIAQAGNLTLTGLRTFASQSVVNVTSMTVINPTNSYILLASTGGLVTIGLSIPAISTGSAIANGTMIVLGSTVTSDGLGTVSISSGTTPAVHLGAATRTIGAAGTLTLIYNSTKAMWLESAFGAN